MSDTINKISNTKGKPDPSGLKFGEGVQVKEEIVDNSKKKASTNCTLQARWEENFDRLLEFREKHGHCLVPNRYAADPQLGSWVSTQRRQYKILISGSSESTPMTPARASRLMNIGFEWSTKDPRHVPWETRFKELRNFAKKYGHAQVPIGWEDNVRLSNWVSTQRQEYKLMQRGRSSRLTDERIKLLNDIGFVWEAQRGGPRRRKKGSVPVPKGSESVDSSENNSVDESPAEIAAPIQPTSALRRGFAPLAAAAGGIPLASIHQQSLSDTSNFHGTFENEELVEALPVVLNGNMQQYQYNFPNEYDHVAEVVPPDIMSNNAESSSWASGGAYPWQLFPPYHQPMPSPMSGRIMPNQGIYPVTSPWPWHPGTQTTGMPHPNIIAMNPNLQRLPNPSDFNRNMANFATAKEEFMYNVGVRRSSEITDNGVDCIPRGNSPKENSGIIGDRPAVDKIEHVHGDEGEQDNEDPLAIEKGEGSKTYGGLFGSESRRSPTSPFRIQPEPPFDADIFADADESNEGVTITTSGNS